jgi:hypothetical protein
MGQRGLWLALWLVVAAMSCSDGAKKGFNAAAQLDRQGQQLEAAQSYVKAHRASPESSFGKLARSRAEIIYAELGAQHLQAKRWTELNEVADHILDLDGSSKFGALYKGYATYGQDQVNDVSGWLEKAQGNLRGVSPPSPQAVEATAKALFRGATQGATSALEGSIVDERFLTNLRTRLSNRVMREQTVRQRRQELLKQNDLDSMATLLDNYADSPEAAKVRTPYATKISAKLKSVETVGPPTVEDPDPIATLVDALRLRAPEEKVSKAALSKIEALRGQWEEHFSESLENIDELVAEHQQKAIESMAKVISDKCAPQLTKVRGGDEAALTPLEEARQEALKLIPNGLAEEEMQDLAVRVHAACSPPTKQ